MPVHVLAITLAVVCVLSQRRVGNVQYLALTQIVYAILFTYTNDIGEDTQACACASTCEHDKYSKIYSSAMAVSSLNPNLNNTRKYNIYETDRELRPWPPEL